MGILRHEVELKMGVVEFAVPEIALTRVHSLSVGKDVECD